MRLIARLFKILLVLLAVGLGFWFTLINTQLVSLNLFGFVLPEAKLGIWVLGGFGAGVVAGLLISLWSYAAGKQRLLRQGRQLNRSEKELAKLRSDTAP
mgnify:CR=1 FL=1